MIEKTDMITIIIGDEENPKLHTTSTMENFSTINELLSGNYPWARTPLLTHPSPFQPLKVVKPIEILEIRERFDVMKAKENYDCRLKIDELESQMRLEIAAKENELAMILQQLDSSTPR